MQKLTMLGKSYSTPLPQGNTIRITLTPKDVMYFQCTLEYKIPFPPRKTQPPPLENKDFHKLYQKVFLDNIFSEGAPVTLTEQLFHLLCTRVIIEYVKLWSNSIRKALLDTLHDASPQEIVDGLHPIFSQENLDLVFQQESVAKSITTQGMESHAMICLAKLKAIVALSDFTLVHNPELPEEAAFTYILVD